MISLLRSVTLLIFGFVWLMPSTLLLAQTRSLLDFYQRDRASVGTFSDQKINMMRLLNDRAQEQTNMVRGALVTVPLEGALDPSEYIIGPNDLFTISVGGLEPLQVPSPVTSDGYLVLPGIGRVQVAGQTLESALAEADDALKANFQNVRVDIALSQPRQFYVHVTGAVPEPGKYLALPVSRVEDVLKQAFFLVDYDPGVTNYAYRPALRNVHIRHRDGTQKRVDLVHYYRTGDVKHNPYLRDGDVVHIPSFLPEEYSVYVDGEVAFPGEYDYRPDDTLLDMLCIGTGQEDIGTLETVRLTRRLPDGSTTSSLYHLADLTADGAEPVPLQPLDHIHVPKKARLMGSVEVEGFVQYPGTYPIEIGQTTLRDLVEMAGGLRPDALVNGAYLDRLNQAQRKILETPITEEERNRQRFTAPYMFLTDTSRVLQQMRLGDLDFLSRYYLARALQTENRVSVDIATALEPESPPVYLVDHDRLFVPRDEQTVRVVGHVVRPGAVAYQPGVGIDAYIGQVGGRAPESSGVYVIKAGTGHLLPARDAEVLSGDIVFVDRKGGDPITPDLERLALQQRDDSRRNTQFIVGIAATTVGIVVNALLIRNLIRD